MRRMTGTDDPRAAALSAGGLTIAGAAAGLILWGLVVLSSAILGLGLVVALVAVLVPALAQRHRRAPASPTRVVLIGVAAVASALADDLGDCRRVTLVGRVGPPSPAPSDVPWLGTVDDLCRALEAHRIDLLVLSDSVPRLEVFDAIERSCRHLSVRLSQLSEFYEGHFKHVPMASINSAWFQWLLHPRHRIDIPLPKRVFDVVVSAVLLVVTAPGMLVAAAVVRLDGGPAFYRQVRIGERGAPFHMIKLRTMDHRATDRTTWTQADDDRVTRIGHFLRRTHFDELPQLVNVLRGEMSLVGPRPEQPQYVARLEQACCPSTRGGTSCGRGSPDGPRSTAATAALTGAPCSSWRTTCTT